MFLIVLRVFAVYRMWRRLSPRQRAALRRRVTALTRQLVTATPRPPTALRGIHHSPLSGRRILQPPALLRDGELTNVRRQLEDVIVGEVRAEVQRERVAVIRVPEGHTVLSKALLGGLEIVHDERDVPEPGRLRLAGGRRALRLKQPELESRLAEEHPARRRQSADSTAADRARPGTTRSSARGR